MIRQAEPDQACAQAVDLARRAAAEIAGPGQVGEHVGIEVDGDRVVTHLFSCLDPAYAGWRWAVTVARAARSRTVTVSESVLLPGPDSLLAPPWVPWTERVRPGDLKAGGLMPAGPDDERLVPFVVIEGEAGLLDWEDSTAWRLGLAAFGGVFPGGPPPADAVPDTVPGAAGLATGSGKELPGGGEPEGGRVPGPGAGRARERRDLAILPARVLSAAGRDEAAARWYDGEPGPSSALARAAPATCLTCGFLVRLSGSLGRVFGVCANGLAPDDGKVVAVDHGCGAHSEGARMDQGGAATIDELGYEVEGSAAAVPGSVLEAIDHELA